MYIYSTVSCQCQIFFAMQVVDYWRSDLLLVSSEYSTIPGIPVSRIVIQCWSVFGTFDLEQPWPWLLKCMEMVGQNPVLLWTSSKLNKVISVCVFVGMFTKPLFRKNLWRTCVNTLFVWAFYHSQTFFSPRYQMMASPTLATKDKATCGPWKLVQTWLQQMYQAQVGLGVAARTRS